MSKLFEERVHYKPFDFPEYYLNLAFPKEATPKWITQCHIEAWKQGIKTLYYMRTESVLRGDIAASAMSEDCLSCDG
jgi:ribonucleotide reductase alpha subunit